MGYPWDIHRYPWDIHGISCGYYYFCGVAYSNLINITLQSLLYFALSIPNMMRQKVIVVFFTPSQNIPNDLLSVQSWTVSFVILSYQFILRILLRNLFSTVTIFLLH
jgi:hypothetical protein